MSQKKIKHLIVYNSILVIAGIMLFVYKLNTIANSAKNFNNVFELAMTLTLPTAVILFLVITHKPEIMRVINYYYLYVILLPLILAIGWAVTAKSTITNGTIMDLGAYFILCTVGLNTCAVLF